MIKALEDRVAVLERQVRELLCIIAEKEPGHAWRTTLGMSAGDPAFEEMVRLGREYRDKQKPKKKRGALTDAGS